MKPRHGSDLAPFGVHKSHPRRAVFLSYASEDTERANHLAELLRADGVEVWYDRSELRGGDSWDQTIRAQIAGCALFVALISRSTQTRLEGYFRREWKLAVDRTHDMAEGLPFLLPVLIDGVQERQAVVPQGFRNVQWTRVEHDAEIKAFARHVADLLGTRASTATPHASTAGPLSGDGLRPSATFNRPRWLVPTLGIVSVALCALALLAWRSAHRDASTASDRTGVTGVAPADLTPKSIAVLPFVDMSEARDKEYFSDGLSEELIDHLAHSADLKVIARTSSFQFKGKNDDVRVIGQKLGVAHLLEGSVRASGSTLRITVQLVRTSDGSHLWSRTYDRQLSDLFQVQDEIAGTVAQALRIALGGSVVPVRDVDPQAHDMFLQANYLYLRFHPGDLERSIELYQAALKIDPSYSMAWVNLARAYIWEYSSFTSSVGEHEANARAALAHALSIDPKLSTAHRWMARVHMNFRHDWNAARREFETAVALDPGGADGERAKGDLAAMLAFTQLRFDDAIEAARRDLRVDPWVRMTGTTLRGCCDMPVGSKNLPMRRNTCSNWTARRWMATRRRRIRRFNGAGAMRR